MDIIKDICSDKVRNVLSMEDNLTLVESKLKILSCRASDLKKEVTKAEETGRRKRKREVENWFEEVEQTENEFNELKCRIGEERLWNNLSSGDSLVKIRAKIERLLEQSKDFEGRLWLDDHENRGEPLLVTENLGGQKLQRGLETICDWLIKEELFNIGIYGMGGVGKTTLAKCIHNHLLKTTDFKIFWVTVSQNFSVKKLQDDIAKQVPLDLSREDDKDRRAAMLSRAIANNSLLILDDVWEVFSLEEVGIPSGPNKCRLIWTTRSSQVCDRMLCVRKYLVPTFDKDESWGLFKQTLATILSEDEEKIAKSVTNRCAGLPLGIITTASSMRGVTDIREWTIVLEQLKSSSVGHHEMEDEVFPILEWSFNRLRGYEGPCFLYCCLYPEDHEIEREELIDLFIFAELIPRRESMELERSDGHAILNKLVKVCLLEEAKNLRGDECVRMHDLIRDMALRITSGRYNSKNTQGVPRFLVKSNIKKSSNHLPVEREELKDDLVAVSVFPSSFDLSDNILEIPPLVSPKSISTLIINRVNIREIPDSFLQHICGLKVLNLEWCIDLRWLPNCISEKVNLTALLLEGCKCLESVPPLGKLKKLRILNLLGTKVDDVPQGLEELVNLERLYMGGWNAVSMTRLSLERKHARALPQATFSKLYHLQHLVLPAAAVHISHLPVLNELQLYVGRLTYDQFSKFRWWPTHYKMHIFDVDPNDFCLYHYDSSEGYNAVEDCWRHRWVNQLMFERCNFQEGLDVVLPLENLHSLGLYRCSGLSDGFFHRWIDRSKDLYHLLLQDLDELKFVLNLSSPDDDEGVASNLEGALSNVRVMQLSLLRNLVGLINIGRVSVGSLISPGTFSSLEKLEVYSCHGLKKLFSVQLVQQCLQNLKYLYVIGCDKVEEIVGDNDDHDLQGGVGIVSQPSSSGPSAPSSHELLLPKLKRLCLGFLPKLENVCSPTIMIRGEQPTTFKVYRCFKLKRLPSFSSTKITYDIEGSNEWWNSLEWNNLSDKDAVQPFFTVEEHGKYGKSNSETEDH